MLHLLTGLLGVFCSLAGAGAGAGAGAVGCCAAMGCHRRRRKQKPRRCRACELPLDEEEAGTLCRECETAEDKRIALEAGEAAEQNLMEQSTVLVTT